MRLWIALVLGWLAACGGAPAPEPAAKPAAETKPRIPDHQTWFALEGRSSFEVVEDNLLGKDWLPAGNVAQYDADGKQYTLFLAITFSPDAAGLLSFEAKGKLADAKFVPSFGGYFGMDDDTPWFVFSKGKYLLGVVGLPQDEADAVARGFAGRVRAD